MAERKSISKKIRFEVFKRDSFTCQYCGRMAPDVVLEIDHINPVVNGGNNGIMNLVTSCFDCNRGKGKRKLTDKEEVKKQQDQLKELNEKREQLKMMLEWRSELERFTEEQVATINGLLGSRTGSSLSEIGKAKANKWIKEFGLTEVLDCMELSINQYYDSKNEKTVDKVIDYVPKICSVRRRQKDDPYLSKRNYLRASIRNKISIYNENRVRLFLNTMVDNDTTYHEVYEILSISRNWTDFWNNINDTYEGEW